MPALKKRVKEQMLGRRAKGSNLPVRYGGKEIRAAVEPAPAATGGNPASMELQQPIAGGMGRPGGLRQQLGQITAGKGQPGPGGRIDMGPPGGGGMPPPARPAPMRPAATPEAAAVEAQGPGNVAQPTPAAEAPIPAPGVAALPPGAAAGAGRMAPGGGLRARMANMANTAGAAEQAPGQGLGPVAGRFAPPTGDFISNWMRGRKKVPTRRRTFAPATAGGFR